MTRDDAIKRVLVTLRSPLMLMAIPDRELALKLARDYAITAEDLLEAATRRAFNT